MGLQIPFIYIHIYPYLWTRNIPSNKFCKNKPTKTVCLVLFIFSQFAYLIIWIRFIEKLSKICSIFVPIFLSLIIIKIGNVVMISSHQRMPEFLIRIFNICRKIFHLYTMISSVYLFPKGLRKPLGRSLIYRGKEQGEILEECQH